ncbi:MAG: hypothetical protein IE923_03645 [Micrococcales bacterium]|nr:hypothetical protein [Micrococcales bacterium]
MSPRPLTTDTDAASPGQQPERDWDAYWRAHWIDDSHRRAIHFAEKFANAPADRLDPGAWMALFVGAGDRTCVGTFLMAFDSASRALDIERRDRDDVFWRLIAERRSDLGHERAETTSYGPPWSSTTGGHGA